jgi:ubiquinol-cytochrome c reductase iron-sulfur subunit
MASSAEMGRRKFLYALTGVVGATGLAAAVWPLIDQMNPDAATIAGGDIVDVDLAVPWSTALRLVHWHQLPIFVVRGTPNVLAALQEPERVARLIDPDSNEQQQPAYAKNWHRSLHPEWMVLVGVCTYCRCVLTYLSDNEVVSFESSGTGVHFCPCCAAKFDLAGRVYRGTIARHNLPVPPHSFPDARTLRIGRNPAGQIFNFESIKQI